ncbi:hypothetical protein B0J13DRAFT_553643 [Dactylonectria estremocensis]|uniref:Uncharacterized protein n=1 Tax=Dactylonectria estremocensis TaxID=1079267 RepID=A0A9P9EVV7_9HYPO|nr:hypothetical protein B0J13DRAFT_553643 [Dactylonectria estremocensis]
MSHASDAPSDELPKPSPLDDLAEGEDEPNPNIAEFTCVSIFTDTTEESFLGSDKDSALGSGDSSALRKTVTEAVRSTLFQAHLEPLYFWKHNSLHTYLLRFCISFQLPSHNGQMQQAIISVRFEDAPDAPDDGSDDTSDSEESGFDRVPHPNIIAFYAENGEVSVSKTNMEKSGGSGVVATTPGAAVAEEKMLEESGRVTLEAQGLGKPEKHQVVWTITGHEASGGIPETVKLPLIVATKTERRFSASLALSTRYRPSKNSPAGTMTVLGKCEEPIYIDPTSLERIALGRKRSRFDETIIAEKVEDLSQCDLSAYSSFGI